MILASDSGHRALLRGPVLGVGFVLLAVVLTWPLAPRLGDGIPLGTERVATVPLLNLWTLAWNVESLGGPGYWDAPIFHPAPAAFGLSEPQPLTGAVAAMFVAATGSPVVAYNLILIGALAMNGFLAALGLRALGLSRPASIGGGLVVLTLPFVHQELGVLQLVPLAGVFAMTAAVARFGRRPGIGAGLLLGVAVAFAAGIALQTAVFAGLALAPVAVVLWVGHRRDRRAWAGLAAGGVLAATLVAPLLLGQRQAFAHESLERSVETQVKLSARAGHYRTSAWAPLWSLPGVKVAKDPGRRAFWPGASRLALAVAGCVLCWREPRWRTTIIAAALVLVTAFVLSLAGRFEDSVLAALRTVPGLAQVRSWFRFALFVQLAVCVLAALGLEGLGRRLARRVDTRVASGLVLGLAVLAAIEVRPVMGPIQPLPSLRMDLPWLAWVLESTEPDDVLAFVPFPDGRSSEDYLGTTQWMYWQIRHWRPMVNGYSGFFPAEFRRLKRAMKDFPSVEALEALAERGVRFCIVHRAFADLPAEVGEGDGLLRLRRVFRDRTHALDVFELTTVKDEGRG